MSMNTPVKWIAIAAITGAAGSAAAFEPEGKVECLAPADPGGGWDFTCRSVGTVLEELDLVPRGVQTVNMAGAGGRRGLRPHREQARRG